MKVKQKHRDLVRHFLRFSDDKTPPSDAEIRSFIQWESTGKASDILAIERLLQAKRSKEITLKMMYEEVFSYWSFGWGWALPLVDVIEDEDEDKFMKASVGSMFDTLQKEGVQAVLLRHTEFSDKQKHGWIESRNRVRGVCL